MPSASGTLPTLMLLSRTVLVRSRLGRWMATAAGSAGGGWPRRQNDRQQRLETVVGGGALDQHQCKAQQRQMWRGLLIAIAVSTADQGVLTQLGARRSAKRRADGAAHWLSVHGAGASLAESHEQRAQSARRHAGHRPDGKSDEEGA